jgi:hypothetical protein
MAPHARKDDPCERQSPTRSEMDCRNTPVMEEPVHYQENLFWDLVTDWLMATPEAALRGDAPMPPDEGEDGFPPLQ